MVRQAVGRPGPRRRCQSRCPDVPRANLPEPPAVTDVNWLVSIGGTDTIVTGSGTYKFGGEFALQQQLSLDLQVGGDKVQHFDSGLVTGPAPFPDIKVTISANGQVCFDTVFEVTASPVPLDQIHAYCSGQIRFSSTSR